MWVTLICLLFLHRADAPDLPRPTRQPAVVSDAEKAALQEGVTLHEARRYNEAIAKYQEVLRQNPANLAAIYELAFSCYAARNYTCAKQAALTGAGFQSPSLASFYLLIASIDDDTGDPKAADAVYRFALEQAPNDPMLHFNYGVNLARERNWTEARKQFETALTLNPNHPGSHLQLAVVYEATGYRVPAILAYSRFLALEPASQRAVAVVPKLQSMLVGNVDNGKKPGNITITVAEDQPKDEGDFTSADLAISIGVAAATTEEGKKRNPFENVAETYLVLGEVLGRAEGNGFAVRFYGPYFKRLTDQKLTSAFVAHAWQSANLDGAEKWQDKHLAQLAEFRACCIKN